MSTGGDVWWEDAVVYQVDPLLGTMADFDSLIADAAAHQIRVIVDLVPNHGSSAHPLFKAALAAVPGSRERDRFILRQGRGPGGELPPNNWPSSFGGTRLPRIGTDLSCTSSTGAPRDTARQRTPAGGSMPPDTAVWLSS